MRTKVLVLFSFITILVFPQYAFSMTFDNSTDTNATSSVTTTSDTETSSLSKATQTTQLNSNETVQTNNSDNSSQSNSIDESSTNNSFTYSTSTSSSSTISLISMQSSQSATSTNSNSSTSVSVSNNTTSAAASSSNDTKSASTTNNSSSSNTNTSSVSNTNALTFPTHNSTTNNVASSTSNIPTSTSTNSTLTLSTTHSTTVTVIPNTSKVFVGSSVAFNAVIADTSNSPKIPDGTVSWNDGNAGGTFSPTSCTLSSGSCIVSYTPSTTSANSVTITASYSGDGTHSSSTGTSSLIVNSQQSTIITITPNSATIYQGSKVTFTVNLTGNSSSTIPTGTVSWSDGNAGGAFTPTSCTLSSGSCTTSYALGISKSGKVTITVSYGGDEIHSVDTATAALTVNLLHGTIITIAPNPAAVIQGSKVLLTASVADNSSAPIIPSGTISWSDGNAGGTFDQTSCTLSDGSCATSYTPSTSSSNSVTITASYGGDGTHYGGYGVSHVSITVLPSSLSLSTDQAYYAFGDVVTLSVNLPGQSLQNIAVGISDPNGENIISRTVTTDENGEGTLQFKIPNTYQTGIYQDFATAVVDGKSYTNSTEFNVIKSRGISIDSVQITNQEGNPVSMLKKGQNGFVKVSISSGEKIPALLTLNLFDANQSSLGTASIQSVVNPGQSNVTLSFFIPSDAQSGLSNVYTDAYSDWPANGGTPLTTESCLATDLQDPSTFSVSYVPNPPHSCTTSSSNGNGAISGTANTQNVAMSNNQATVTLGVTIQNDSMTFMSPAKAHLLALAYDSGTAVNTQDNSVALVSLNLNNMNTTNTSIQTSGNVTKIGPAQFTTIAGPDIQNNPMALKILQEIEESKRQVANILGNETAAKLNEQLVLQQRQAAANQLKQDLTALAQANANTTPDVAYTNFLTTVSDNRTQSVFQNEYNFMQQRIGAANTAMQTALDNGATLEQALSTFDQYATINHVQMVALNNELNVAYGLADSRIQSCFDSKGQLTVVNGINPCVANVENNSTGSNGISIVSVQPTDQQGNPVSLLKRGQTGYVKVVIDSNTSVKSLVTVNIFDPNVSSLGTVSAQYTLSPGQSEVILPYHVSAQSETGLASIYANIFTDWPDKGGTSQTNELSYFVGLS